MVCYSFKKKYKTKIFFTGHLYQNMAIDRKIAFTYNVESRALLRLIFASMICVSVKDESKMLEPATSIKSLNFIDSKVYL